MAVFAAANPDDDLRHREPNTALHCRDKLIGVGTLSIADSAMVWESPEKKITLPWPSILLHAVCRDASVSPHDSLYLHTDADIPGITTAPSDDSEDEGHDECPPATELHFVPENKQSLTTMYNIMVSCQSLHPDPNDDFSPDEDFFEEDEEEELQRADSQMENMHINENGRNGNHDDHEMFEDADENFPEH